MIGIGLSIFCVPELPSALDFFLLYFQWFLLNCLQVSVLLELLSRLPLLLSTRPAQPSQMPLETAAPMTPFVFYLTLFQCLHVLFSIAQLSNYKKKTAVKYDHLSLLVCKA